MDKSAIGDRMKRYEATTDARIMPRLPLIVRLDGRSFSTFTKGFNRPFDSLFRMAMVETAKFLIKETHAKIAYTQSDEITLLLHIDNVKGSTLFEGRVQKVCSIFASLASTFFALQVQQHWPHKIKEGKCPIFDCRVFPVPDKMEAYNAFLWRENDCTKNSIQMVAQAHYSHKQCMHKSTNELQHMLITEMGVNWNDFTSGEKRGTYVRREKLAKPMSPEVLATIPEQHREQAKLAFRHHIIAIDMPPLYKVANAIEVLFDKAKPQLRVANDSIVAKPTSASLSAV
jgi:tRNA(His) guanylyltransferase